MDSGTTQTSDLIRTLSRRQWAVSLTVVVLTLGSLIFGWQGIASNEQTAEVLNLAGRQRMLSQRMAMFVVLHEREPEVAAQSQYRDMARAAAAEFEQAHARLTANAAKLGPGSPIHALYFGPAGNVDGTSKHYLGLVRTVVETPTPGKPADPRTVAIIVSDAANGLIGQLQEISALYQRHAEDRVAQMLRLMQIVALMIVSSIAFGMFRVFRPVTRHIASDIAARETTQRALQESEERFRTFSESSSDWFWETDAQHRFRWIQDGRSVKLPLSEKTVLGMTRLELLPGIELAAAEKWKAYQADLNAHRPFRDLEYQIGGDEQALRWISVGGQPFFDKDGSFLGYRGTARYIQARKDIEASLVRLQIAIEQSPVSIMIIDADTRIIYVNAHFSAVSGYSAPEAIGRRPKTLLDSGKTPHSVFSNMNKTLAEGRNWSGELCFCRKNGELYWDRLLVSPVQDHTGKVSHYIAVGEDVTEQIKSRRREQNHNRILEAIANGTPLPETLTLIVAMAEAELSGGICTILRLDRTQGKLFSACGSALSKAYTDAIEGLPIGEEVGSCGTAAFTGRRVVVADINSHPYWQAWRAVAAAEDLRACWSQPIIASAGKVLGTLAIYYRTPRSPIKDEIQVIELVTSLAAICLERAEAEGELRKQEEQARALLAQNETILDNALVGIVYLKHRRVVSCNRRLEEIFGYGPDELIGKSTEVFYATQRAFKTIGEDAYRANAESKSFSAELLLKHKDGTLFHGALNGRVLDPAHPQEGSIWVYADISKRYKAEQEVHKLLQAIEQSPVSIVITNLEGLIEYVNPRFIKDTGYTAYEAIGQNPRFLQSGETPPEVYQGLWQTLLAGKEWRGGLRNKRKNGELFWEEASILPIHDDKGETTHYLAIKEDITERKKIEDELEQHRTHLEDLVGQRTADLSAALAAAKVADQAKDAFLANVSHELRTPLNAVIGLSELARRISTDPRQQDYLDKVTGAGKSLAGIINDLLDLSKISADRLELEASTFSLRALIKRSSSVMDYRASEKGLKLIEEIDDAVPDVLVGDPLRIEQILMNLFSNAIKFTPAGQVKLRIGVHARTEARACLDIDVEDTGIGLAEESIARLFQPFAQADTSVSRKFGGTGLGLALCKRLAEMMDGDIRITSREGVGTTFHVRIWLGLGDAADLPEAASSTRNQTLPAKYRDAQLLVVDDQPLNREIVEALLAEVGITPRTATNGKEALDILQAAGPDAFDLILMDIQMPVMDGLTATRTIRTWAGFDALPIVAMSAHAMEHEKTISIAAGMNGHIGKPFETSQFYQLLAHWIPEVKQQLPCAAEVADAEMEDISGSHESRNRGLPPISAGGLQALRSIDTRAGLDRFVGNEKRYRHWLTEFLTEAPGYAAQIRQLLAEDNREAARQSAHAVKGRVGMLGMSTLHPIAAAVEAALMQDAPIDALLEQMQATIELLCVEIKAGLGGTAPAPAAAPAAEPERTPAGPIPQSIAQLIAMLECSDGSSTETIERCLSELKDSNWAPRLQQALVATRNFDFETAIRMLSPDDQETARGN